MAPAEASRLDVASHETPVPASEALQGPTDTTAAMPAAHAVTPSGPSRAVSGKADIAIAKDAA